VPESARPLSVPPQSVRTVRPVSACSCPGRVASRANTRAPQAAERSIWLVNASSQPCDRHRLSPARATASSVKAPCGTVLTRTLNATRERRGRRNCAASSERPSNATSSLSCCSKCTMRCDVRRWLDHAGGPARVPGRAPRRRAYTDVTRTRPLLRVSDDGRADPGNRAVPHSCSSSIRRFRRMTRQSAGDLHGCGRVPIVLK
jgi:hypothetical protein